MVETIKEPIKGTHVHDTSFVTTSDDSVVTGVGIIGRGGQLNQHQWFQLMCHECEYL